MVLDLVLLAAVVVDPILKRGLENDAARKGKHIPVLNLLRHGQERLLNIGRVLGGSLKEGDRELVCELLQNWITVFLASLSNEATGILTLATVYSTTFLLVKSDLLPTRSLFTPSDAYRSISCSHCLTFVKVSMPQVSF